MRIVSMVSMTGLAVLALASCTRSAPVVNPAAASPYRLQGSIREIMDSLVDPSADVLWESVVFTVTEAGEDAHQPHTPEEWKAVRRGALNLIESTNLLVMPGRHIAPVGAPREPGEASTEVLQKKLDENRDSFVGFAQALRAVGIKALAAADAQDPDKLLEVGGEIDEVCEACHLVYWYPPDLSKR